MYECVCCVGNQLLTAVRMQLRTATTHQPTPSCVLLTYDPNRERERERERERGGGVGGCGGG